MKKIFYALCVCAAFAATYFGIKFIDEYYIGIPVDAVYSDMLLLDHAPDDFAPGWYAKVSELKIEDNAFDVYAFFGENGSVEQRLFVRKDTVAYSGFRETSTVTDSEYGFVILPSSGETYKELSYEEMMAAVREENYFSGTQDPVKPMSPKAAELYRSDEDVAYSVVCLFGAAEVSEDGIISVDAQNGKKYYRFCEVEGREYGMFFPCASSGEVAPGAFPSKDLAWRCKLVWDDTEIAAEPSTQAEKEEKEALIADRRQRRLDAEYRARIEAEERAAREKAEREAREKAEREEAERAARERAAKEAAIKEKIANLSEEERNELREKYSKASMYLEKNLDKYIAYGMENEGKSASVVVRTVNTGRDKPFYTDMQPTDTGKGFLMLVNKYNYLSSSYVPNLKALPKGYGNGSMQSTAAAAFVKMVDAAKAEGLSLRSVSPYRSYATQKTIYNNYVRSLGQSVADRGSARPGSSEHQTGLAVDINTAETYDHFEKTAEYAWLIENCWKYGFILRYREGTENITGYMFEPWHYRYVGVGPAEQIMKWGITFEEYYAYYIDK